MFTALAGRTVYVQAVEGPELAEKAKAERTVTWVNRAPRGDITGRDGTVLASSAVSYDVGVNQSAIAQYERTEMRLNESTGANEKVVVDYGATAVAAQLAPILDVDPLELGAKLVGNRSYEVIAQEVSPDTWRKIKALDIPGVEPDQRTRRTYPAGTVAGNVLGFTHEGEHNRELIGAAGLELTQNKLLTGTDGKGSEEVGRSGVIIPTGEQEDEPARPGATVRTTLNPDLQSIAQETIDKTVAAQHADWGIVMAMEPATGKVVVLADSNSVDPSDPSATSEENRTARSVQAVFEPGSVGKVVTFATALEEGVIKPEDTWTIPYTWTSANGQTFKDSHEHETQTMTTAGVLAESSNVGTVQIGEKLADDVRYDYMKRFGWGQATGIEMPAESDGILYPPSSWDDRTRYTTMFGPDAHSHGLKPDLITDPVQVKQVTAFFGWTAWGSSAQRPGHDYSYTNNWPAESLVGNAPTGDLMIWSVLSLIVLIGGTGVMFAIYGRWSQKIGWHSEEAPALSFRQPEEVGLTKSQRVVAWYVFTIAALFLVQTLLGALAEHYRADVLSFFGFDLGRRPGGAMASTVDEI